MKNIIVAHATKNLCYKANQKMTPAGIVVHSTGANNPTLRRYVDAPEEVGKNQYDNHWNREMPEGQKVCVHAFIGYDINNEVRVAEILPLDICCWGVGRGTKGSYNYDPAYIQFEICEDSMTDKTYYEKAFGVAVEYSAYLCKKFGLKVENIVGHCEAHDLGYGSDHSDPEKWMRKYGETMNDFRKKVSELLAKEAEEGSGEENVLYKVQLGAYKGLKNAEKQLQKVISAGFSDAFIIKVVGNETDGTKAPEIAEPSEEIPPQRTVKVGDRVKLKYGAKTYTGGGLASFVYERIYDVVEVVRNRVVISHDGDIMAAVKAEDLIFV